MGEAKDVRNLVRSARDEIDHGYQHDGTEPEVYVGQVIDLLESGDITEVADDWARQQTEYVYSHMHSELEADYRHSDEWQEAERGAAEAVAARYRGIVPFGGPNAGRQVLAMRDQLLAETVAVFLADVYTTAVWDWLHMVRVESPVANAYLNDQAELFMAGVRDTPHFD